MSFQSRFGILIAALALVGSGLPLAAQTSGLCGPQLSSFLIEHPENLSDIQSTLTPQLNPALLAGVFAGTQEIRSRITYSAATQILEDQLFLVNVGAPNPTPPTVNFAQIRFGYIIVYVDHVYATCAPYPSFMLSGVIGAGTAIYLPPAGDPFALSFAYNIPGGTNGLTASFGPGTTVRDIVTDSAGLAVLYHTTINATVTLTGAVPLAPLIKVVLPGGAAPGTTPVAVSTSPFQLDASGTVDPNQGILSYRWVTDKPAAFWPSNESPIPQITFQNGAGSYKVTLYVTSNAGMSASTSFVIAYSGATN